MGDASYRLSSSYVVHSEMGAAWQAGSAGALSWPGESSTVRGHLWVSRSPRECESSSAAGTP
eukprot:scaffold327747_cov55-Tisochrysis_lutea.AAC.2